MANYARIRFIAPCKDRTAVFSTIWFTTPLDHTSTTSFTDGGPWKFRIGKHTLVRARRPARHDLPDQAARLEGGPRLIAAATRLHS